MLHSLQQLFAPAAMERLTLLVNHVLGSEAVATQRLMPHVGKVVQVEAGDWPKLLPPPPPLAWRITAAGLLEWCGLESTGGAELRVCVPADNPALLITRILSGDLPAVEVTGDAQLAADVDWLLQNLRWDLATELERVLPAPVAAGLVRIGSAFAQALRTAVQAMGSLRDRWQSRPGA